MATFLQGATDQFGPLELYRPDYSFLTQVYGTKQAQYDRGFQAVKGLHDSLLNSPLSNGENEEFRKQAFQKIQKQISDVSGLDLGDSNIVNSALKIFEPITNDRELAYDMAVTRHYQSERQKMEMYKNSPDVEKRRLYHQDAEEYLNMGQQRLASAKRGTGQIFQAPTNDFVMFEDVQGYLDKAMKDEGLSWKTDVRDGAYIKTFVNGQGAEENFEQWAKQKIGDRFDRQFQVSGAVQTNRAIQGIMQSENVNHETARKILASQVHPQMMEKIAAQGTVLESQISDIDEKIGFLESKYPDIKKNPEVEAIHSMLVQNKKFFEQGVEDLRRQTADLQEKGEDYINMNMEGLMTSEIKDQFTSSWSKAAANKNVEVSMKPDQVVLQQWQMENQRWITQYTQENANWRHSTRLEFDMQKEQFNQFDKDRNFKLNMYKAESDRIKADKAGTKADGTKDKRTVTPTGSFASTEQFTSTDVFDHIQNQSRESLFNAVFGAESGMLNLVVGDRNYGNVYSSISAAKSYADGSASDIKPEQVQELQKFASQYKIKVPDRLSKDQAGKLINMLIPKVIEKAKANAKFHMQIGNYEPLFGGVDAYNTAIASVEQLMDSGKKHEQTLQAIANRVLDENGKPKEAFKNAKVVSYTASGVPILDLSSLDMNQRRSLESSVGQEYKAMSAPMGMTYSINKLNDQELFALTNSNLSQIVSGDGALGKLDLSKLNKEDVRKIFGDNLKVGFDPVKKEALVTLSVTSSKTAENMQLVPGQNLTVKIPYQTLNANPALAEWAGMAQRSSVSRTDFGKFSPFVDNPTATVSSNSMMESTGFKYSITGSTNPAGQYGVKVVIERLNPTTKRPEIFHTGFTPIADRTSPQTWSSLENAIHQAFNMYKSDMIKASQITEKITEKL